MKRILSILAAVLILVGVAIPAHAVTIRTDPTPGATHCGLYKNNVFDADYPVANVGAGNGCLFVIDSQAAGSTIVYTATAIYIDAVWGRVESARSNPLSVARPGQPATPAWAPTPVRASSVLPQALRAPAPAPSSQAPAQ